MTEVLVPVRGGPAHEDRSPRDPVMRSAVHRAHAAIGGTFELRAGWDVPALYGSEKDEVAALRFELGFADISARGKVQLNGAIDGFIQSLTGGVLAPLGTGEVTSGGYVARIGRDWALALVPPSTEAAVIAEIDRTPSDSAMATDVTSALSSFLVAGPRLEDFLARSVTLDLGELEGGRCAATTWARIAAVLVKRDLGSPAVELHVASDHGRYAWETISRLAGHLGGSPVGWRALEMWGWSA